MKRKWFGILGILGFACLGYMLMAEENKADSTTVRERARKVEAAGNFKEALADFQKLTLDPDAHPKLVVEDFNHAILCLRNLGRLEEIDEFREKMVAVHKSNWRALHAAAASLQQGDNYGVIVAGKFYRGHQRNNGRYINTQIRDRVRALQLEEQALPLTAAEMDKVAVAEFFHEFAQFLIAQAQGQFAWRLQILTDTSTLPDWDDASQTGGGTTGAPVDSEGKPVYHKIPASYAEAISDGERWRWALDQCGKANPTRVDEMRYEYAAFLRQQFDVQTMAEYNWFFRSLSENDKDRPQTFALETLAEDETLAKLATGITRFKLPSENNFILILQEISKQAAASEPKRLSLELLATIFTDRRQYPKAVSYLRRSLAEIGATPHVQGQLDQIVKNWGRFDDLGVFPAGSGPKLEYVYRNGKRVEFEAWEIKVPQLLEDMKAYLKSAPEQVDWQRIHVEQIGHQLIWENNLKYLGNRVAQWQLDLQPRPNHFDRRVTVTTPLQKSGAYLLTAKMEDGNVSRVIVWIADTVIAQKQLDQQTWYFLADAATGKPVPKANVEFFGWKQTQVGNRNRWQITTSNFAEFSDADGQVIASPKKVLSEYQWLVIARSNAENRFGFLGFSGVWYADRGRDEDYNSIKVFSITDRPVYRPDQQVKFKFWVRETKYDGENKSNFAGQDCIIKIHNPAGEEVYSQTLKSDEYAGIEGEYSLPKDAKLGVFQVTLNGKNYSGSGSFRVEEYKKPEFEVTVEAPTKPVELGEKITATIHAKYFFGAPVTQAKVKYKIMRTKYTEQWHPTGKWDWFYGRGYWWFAYDYAWYPGWEHWGCVRPFPFWWNRSFDPPELVAEREVEIGEDGTVTVEIDTSVAKAMHGNSDHQYEITAEVVDQSRRTIVGSGNVLVSRSAFKVFTWVDKGHYRTGDAIKVDVQAHTLDQKPVKGTGELKLMKISYDAQRNPVERLVESWKIDTDVDGRTVQQIKAGEAGQYRLVSTLKDDQGHIQEGGYVFVVRGDNFNGTEYRFNDLEIITDKKEYAPGEKVQLLITTDRRDSTVALFLRPTNGVYLPPKIFRINGKSLTTEIEITKKDMPNFFIEAITISNGKLYAELRDVVVPPEKRILNVEVVPSENKFTPGADAKIQVKLSDLEGKPFQGTTVLTMYDKALEYISGGSNVPEIKSFFWKWKRHHHPQTQTNLERYSGILLRPNEVAMEFLGAFGSSVAEDEVAEERLQFIGGLGGGGGGMGGKGIMRGKAMGRGGMMRDRAMLKDGALPAPAMAAAPMLGKAVEANMDSLDSPGAETLVTPTIRTNFADSAFWAGRLDTDAEGMALVSLKMPENLTGWKIKTWGLGHGSQVGQGEAEVVTSKNLLVRLQAPRFFIQKDEVVISANVHNYLNDKKSAKVILEIDELDGAATTCLEGKVERVDGAARESKRPGWDFAKTVEVAAGGESRVDWRIRIDQPGEIAVRVKALTDIESDAMQQQFPAYVHGMLKTEAFSGVIRPAQESGKITVKIPAERRVNDSRIEVRYSPTLAGAMVDALPYLIEFPYGCTEQTLNRFLPSVITQKILLSMNLDLKAIQEKRTNLNAQEIGDDKERAKRWKRFDREPVFDPELMQEMVQDGVKTLSEQQCSDGGWGWFSGWGEHSYPHTTAVVVHGLQVAHQNDVALVPGVLERGIDWLKNYQARQIQLLKNAPGKVNPYKERADNLDSLVFMILTDADVVDTEMRDFLYRDRVQLAAYAKATFGLALQKQAQEEMLAMILENLEQYLVQDPENQTAYLKLPEDNTWWYWYGSGIEANAYYLKLLAKTEPQGERASQLVKYLLNNRKHATYWNSTRDTALCIEALADYLIASGEDKPDMTIEVWVDGKMQKEVNVTPETLFSFDNQFLLTGDAIESGAHEIELRKKGTGPLYFNAYVTNFTLEDFITKAGLEIKVDRKFYKLIREEKSADVAGSKGQAIKQNVEKYRREELPNLSTLKSGDLVEIELEIDSKNDYEYLLFEDMKASGFEPVEVRSGYGGNDLGAYMELRDERVAFFVRQLTRGKHSVSYRLRAEIPGKFSALPTRASAMYAPELKANSDELKVQIED